MALLHLERTHPQLSLPTRSPHSHVARPCGHLDSDAAFLWPDLYSGSQLSLEGDCPGPDQIRSGPCCSKTLAYLGTCFTGPTCPGLCLCSSYPLWEPDLRGSLGTGQRTSKAQERAFQAAFCSGQPAPSWPPVQIAGARAVMSCPDLQPGFPKSCPCLRDTTSPLRQAGGQCRHPANSPSMRMGVGPRPHPGHTEPSRSSLLATYGSLAFPLRELASPPACTWGPSSLWSKALELPEWSTPKDHKEGARHTAFCSATPLPVSSHGRGRGPRENTLLPCPRGRKPPAARLRLPSRVGSQGLRDQFYFSETDANIRATV